VKAEPALAQITRLAILFASVLLVACSNDGPVGAGEKAPPDPPPPADDGSLEVTTSTLGRDTDPDGYTVAVDNGTGQPIGANETVTILSLFPGSHQVALTDLATPCAAVGDNPRTVMIPADGGVAITFDIICQASLMDQIAFWSISDGGSSEIHVANQNGSEPLQLTRHPASDTEPGVSPDGRQILFVTTRDGNSEIYVMNANGSGVLNLTNDPAVDFRPRWSPDGTKIAFTSDRDSPMAALDIFVMNADGSNPVNLTADPANDTAATWSPDGTKIAFTSNRTGDFEIFVMNADGTNPLNLSNDPGRSNFGPAWSPDGSRIAFTSNPGATVGTGGDDEIFVMNTDGSSLVNLTNHTADDFWPSWSTDGSRIAFTSGRTGDLEVFVMNADGSGPANLSNSTGTADFAGFPQAWSP
jgi:TolB protein